MPDLDDIAWELEPETEERQGVLRTSVPGAYHTEALSAATIREWTLVAGLMPTTEADALRALYASTRGPAGTTLLTPPGGSAQVTVAFVDDELRIERVGGDTWSTRIRVREVL